MPRPIILESNFSQWRLGSDSGALMAEAVLVKGFLNPEKGLLSSMEVGLITASVSEKTFEDKPVNSLGELKNDDDGGLLYLSVGDGREPQSAIRACLLDDALDLFLSIIPLDQNKLLQIKKTDIKKNKNKTSISGFTENEVQTIIKRDGAIVELT